MQSEKQYIDLYTEAQQIIKDHAAPVMNEVRDKAFDDFRRLGFPTKKVERYKYTDMQSYSNQIMVWTSTGLKYPLTHTRHSDVMCPISVHLFTL